MIRIIDNLAPLGGRPLPTGGHLGCGLPPGFHAGTGVWSNAFALVPDPDPDDLYYSSFFVVGGTTTNDCGNNVTEAGETCDPPGPGFSPICQTVEVVGEPCPWDCQVEPDQNVGINDFVDLLGQWTQVGSSCDLGEGPDGVGVEDLLALLGHWGPCP